LRNVPNWLSSKVLKRVIDDFSPVYLVKRCSIIERLQSLQRRVGKAAIIRCSNSPQERPFPNPARLPLPFTTHTSSQTLNFYPSAQTAPQTLSRYPQDYSPLPQAPSAYRSPLRPRVEHADSPPSAAWPKARLRCLDHRQREDRYERLVNDWPRCHE
jgi:hypothetical protein